MKNSFMNTIRKSKNLDPDLDRQNVGPDLGLNCLKSNQQAILVVKVGVAFRKVNCATPFLVKLLIH